MAFFGAENAMIKRHFELLFLSSLAGLEHLFDIIPNDKSLGY